MLIKHEDTLAHSKPFLFVLEGWVTLLKDGHGDFEFSFGNAANVCYAVDELGQVVGATVWNYDPVRRVATETFSVVREEFRRQGIYKSIMQEVFSKAKARGAVVMHSGVSITNTPMIEAASKSGGNLLWYRVKRAL